MFGKRDRVKKLVSPSDWIWWIAGLVVIIGSTATYIASLDKTNLQRQENVGMIAVGTVVIAGLLVISAMAQNSFRK